MRQLPAEDCPTTSALGYPIVIKEATASFAFSSVGNEPAIIKNLFMLVIVVAVIFFVVSFATGVTIVTGATS